MTPEDILSHPARVLTPEQRHYYFDYGYVVVEGAIDTPWLDRLRGASAEMVERSRPLARSEQGFVLEDGHTADNPRLRRLSNPVEHHPAFWEFASESSVADAATNLGLKDADELLRATRLFFHACTVGDNTLITRAGAKTGLIMTQGFGDSLHISAVEMPPNARPVIQERDFTIASIAASSAVREEAAAAAATAAVSPGEETGSSA